MKSLLDALWPMWPPTTVHLYVVVVVLVLVLVVVIGYTYGSAFTGFGRRPVKVTENFDYSPGRSRNDPWEKKTKSVEEQTPRTVWDWLTVVTISAVIAFVAFTYASSQANQQRIIQEQQAREAALLSYFDAMSELMFDRKLLTSEAEDPVRDVARARTLVGLLSVGAEHQRDVIRFLYESDVIKPENPENRIVDLTKANLTEANLTEANLTDAHLNGMPLSGIDLRGANLSDGLDVNSRGAVLKAAGLQNAYLGDANLARADLEDANLESANLTDWIDVNDTRGAILKAADLQNANLKYADLTKANLTEANLTEANLTEANLTEANLSEAKGVTQQELEEQTQKLQGAIMPDGSRHD
jgi:uncharacterized protein YjbI with pentapeptide repeats